MDGFLNGVVKEDRKLSCFECEEKENELGRVNREG